MKKLGYVAMALLLALAALGAAYAVWTDTLNINTTVNTGTYSGRFASALSNDPNPGPLGNPTDNGTWSLVSGSPAWTGSRSDNGTGSDNYTACSVSGNCTLTVTFTKPYPGYKGSVGCALTNTGTVPIKVATVTGVQTGGPTALTFSLDGALNQANHAVIDPGAYVLGIIRPSFDASIPRGQTYSIRVDFTFSRWGT